MDDFKFLVEAYEGIYNAIVSYLPNFIFGILLLLLGWLLAKLLSGLVARSLKALRFDRLIERLQLNRQMQQWKINRTPSQLVGRLVYWVFILLLLIGFAEAMNLTMLSAKIGVLLNYIPNIILAAAILLVGLFVAGRIKTFLQASLSSHGVGGARTLANIIFYLIATFVILAVLEQLQLDISLLSSNVMILLGGVALAFAIGYGLSAKEIFPNIISSYYNKGRFQVGDQVRIGETEGEIIELSNISVVIKTASGKRFIPAKKFVSEEVEVLE